MRIPLKELPDNFYLLFQIFASNPILRILTYYFLSSPAHVMPLLEIVRTEKTSPQVIVDLINVGKIIKKVPVVVGNCTGFAVNRMFFPYSQGAHMLANLGVDIYRIDNVITSFGLPMGPFRYLLRSSMCLC